MPFSFDSFDNPDITYGIPDNSPITFEIDPDLYRRFTEAQKRSELFLTQGNVGFAPSGSNLFIVDGQPGDGKIDYGNGTGGSKEPELSAGRVWLRENAIYGDRVRVSSDGERTVIPPDEPVPDATKSEEVLALVWPSAGAAPVTAPNADIPIPGQIPSRSAEAIGEILGLPQRPFGQTTTDIIPFSALPDTMGANHLIQFRDNNPDAIQLLLQLPVEAQRAALSDIAKYVFDLSSTGFGSLDYSIQQELFAANLRTFINLHQARVSHAVNSETSPGQPGDAGQPAGPNLPLQELMRRVAEAWVPPATEPGAPEVTGDPTQEPWEYVPRNPLDHDPEWRAARNALEEQVRGMQERRNEPVPVPQFPELPFQRYNRLMDQIGQIAGTQFLEQWRQFADSVLPGLPTQMSFYTEGMSAESLMTYMELLMKGVPEHVVFDIMRGGDPNEVIRWFDRRHPAATLEPSERREQAEQEIERRLNDPKSPFDNEDWRRYQEAFPDIAEELYRLAAQGADPAAVAEAVQQLLRGFAAAHDILFALRNSGAGGERGGPPGAGGPETAAGAPDDPGAGSSLAEQARALIERIPLENIPRRINPSVADLIGSILRNEPVEGETDATSRVERFIPENLYQTPTELGRLALQALTDPLAHVQNPSAIPLLSEMGVIAEGSRILYASAGGMKGVNTELGHEAGDRLIAGYLINLARELRNAFPEAGSQIHVFKDRSTDVIIVTPPHLESQVIDLLQEFGSRPSMFTTELPDAEFAILNPGLGIQPVGEFPVDSEGRFDLSIFERLYQEARDALEQRKLAGEVPHYPQRGVSPFIIVEDPAELEGMIPLEGAEVPAAENRLRLNEYLRQGGDRLIEALQGLSEEAFAAVRRQLLGAAFTNPHVDGIFNNRMEMQIPRGPDGEIVADPVMGLADLQKLGVINNGIGQALENNALGWRFGDGAIQTLTAYLQVLQEQFDVFVAMPGGDEVVVTGSREAVEQLFAELQRMLQGTVLQAPGPDGQIFELRGLSGAFAIGAIEPDAPHPFPDPLEMERMLQENGAQTGYWPPLFGPDGQPIPVPRP